MTAHAETDVSGAPDGLDRLEVAVDVTGLGLWDWDILTGRLTWNARNRELFGLTHDDPLDIQAYMNLVHPDDRDAVAVAYRIARDNPVERDFVVEHRTAFMPEGKVRWVQARGRVIKKDGVPVRAIGSTLDITDRKTAEEHRNLVLGELAHRAKNGIQVMMAIVAHTARSASDVKEFEEALMARLRSMATSQDQLTEAAGRPLPLPDLLRRALEPFDRDRFDLDPKLAEVCVPTDAVVAVALLTHELATNAVKYGALSARGGRVGVVLETCEDDHAIIMWTETGGPQPNGRRRRGFGSRLIEVALRNYNGWVEAEMAPGGFRARIRLPATRP